MHINLLMSSHLIAKILTSRTSFVLNGPDIGEMGIVIGVANRNVVVTYAIDFTCPRIGFVISAVCNFIIVFLTF